MLPRPYPIFQRVVFLVEASPRVDLRYRRSEFRAHTDTSYASTIFCIEGAWRARDVVRVHRPGCPAVCPVGDVGLRLVVFPEEKRPTGDEYLEDVVLDPEGVFTLVDGNPHHPPI